MSTLHTINGKPVEENQQTQPEPMPTSAAPVSKSHKPECGDVGATGEHGNLGSNAA